MFAASPYRAAPAAPPVGALVVGAPWPVRVAPWALFSVVAFLLSGAPGLGGVIASGAHCLCRIESGRASFGAFARSDVAALGGVGLLRQGVAHWRDARGRLFVANTLLGRGSSGWPRQTLPGLLDWLVGAWRANRGVQLVTLICVPLARWALFGSLRLVDASWDVAAFGVAFVSLWTVVWVPAILLRRATLR